jgi:hypothetical protein
MSPLFCGAIKLTSLGWTSYLNISQKYTSKNDLLCTIKFLYTRIGWGKKSSNVFEHTSTVFLYWLLYQLFFSLYFLTVEFQATACKQIHVITWASTLSRRYRFFSAQKYCMLHHGDNISHLPIAIGSFGSTFDFLSINSLKSCRWKNMLNFKVVT